MDDSRTYDLTTGGMYECECKFRLIPDKDYVLRGGLIVAIFNHWAGKWMVWYQQEYPKMRCIFVRIFHGWFSGFVDFNRGRHFDRKYRK